ncbi:hypothetical protein KW448_08210 [Vibrio fluvialis]|nr:hypothetical protein [Vibrio fluvialis]
MKLTPSKISPIAEAIICDYIETVGCKTETDVANVLELLISKAARAIEKSNGNIKALEVCYRTLQTVQSKPMQVVKH